MEKPGTPQQHDTLVLGPSPAQPVRPAMPADWDAAHSNAGAWNAGAWNADPWNTAAAWAGPAAPQPPARVARNATAVVGATLGSVSLFLALIPLLGIVAWAIAPLGLLVSLVGLGLGMSRRVGRFAAGWGVGTSGLALLICVAWLSLLFGL